MKRDEKIKVFKNKQKILITLAVGLVLILGFYTATNMITRYTGFSISGSENEESSFAECLKKQDISLYVNTDNLVQTIQKIQLDDYLEYVKIINCFGDDRDCLEKGIDSFPTWSINSNKIYKDISFDELSMMSGC